MHRHNSKYGYGKILRDACGKTSNDPIMGEVQHSLFVSTHFFTQDGTVGPPRPQGRGFIPLLSWQQILPFRFQIPIGDPITYWSVPSDISRGRNDQTSAEIPLVMPKLNDELDEETRVSHYLDLVSIAGEVSGSNAVRILLHPRDANLYPELEKRTYNNLIFSSRSSSGPLEALETSLRQMSESSMVVSDYFAAHVFRASALFQTPIHVPSFALDYPIYPTMRELFRTFSLASPDHELQAEISRKILGYEYRRDLEELNEILFRPAWPKHLTRIFVSGYKLTRRSLVRVRESRFGKRNPLISLFVRRFFQPGWQKKFSNK